MTTNSEIAEEIRKEIWRDICSRSGGDHFLESCDTDIQEEIRDEWERLVLDILNKHFPQASEYDVSQYYEGAEDADQ